MSIIVNPTHIDIYFRIAAFCLIILNITIKLMTIGLSPLDYKAKQKDAKDSASRMLTMNILNYFSMVLFALYVIFPTAISWANITLNPILRIAGGAVYMICVIVLYFLYKSLGNNWSHLMITRNEQVLIKNGFYSSVRHPIYTNSIIASISISLLTSNLLIFIVSLTLSIFVASRSWQEEDMLIERFGDEYREYMKRTGMFFPRIQAIWSGGRTEF